MNNYRVWYQDGGLVLHKIIAANSIAEVKRKFIEDNPTFVIKNVEDLGFKTN